MHFESGWAKTKTSNSPNLYGNWKYLFWVFPNSSNWAMKFQFSVQLGVRKRKWSGNKQEQLRKRTGLVVLWLQFSSDLWPDSRLERWWLVRLHFLFLCSPSSQLSHDRNKLEIMHARHLGTFVALKAMPETARHCSEDYSSQYALHILTTRERKKWRHLKLLPAMGPFMQPPVNPLPTPEKSCANRASLGKVFSLTVSAQNFLVNPGQDLF